MPQIPMGDVPAWHAARRPDEIALIQGDRTLTWSQLERAANRRARAFARAGVGPGDLVAIALPNDPEIFVASFAAWKLGATPGTLSHRLPVAEARAILDVMRPSLLVGGLPEWRTDGPSGARAWLPATPDEADLSDAPVEGPIARHWKAMTSGGSTGRPKVILDRGPAVTDPRGPQPLVPVGSVMLNPGPLYHNAPYIVAHTALFGGGVTVNMAKFDAEEVLRLIERHRVTWVYFVPTMMQRIWALGPEIRNRYDLSSLRIVFHMAAPMPRWLKQAWIDWLGPERIMELYGGTERQGTCIVSGVEWLLKPGTVGRPLAGQQVKVFGEDGRELAPGEIGEIYFLPEDGAGSTYRYLGAEARARPGGWESIGDIGWVDEDGYVFLADRRTDLILRGGANIYPAEIEAALAEHPAVIQAVVVGVPCPELGHRVHALVRLADGNAPEAAAEALAAFVATRLSRPKWPESYEFVGDILRDDAGKVRRSALRDERAAWLEAGRAFQVRPNLRVVAGA